MHPFLWVLGKGSCTLPPGPRHPTCQHPSIPASLRGHSRPLAGRAQRVAFSVPSRILIRRSEMASSSVGPHRFAGRYPHARSRLLTESVDRHLPKRHSAERTGRLARSGSSGYAKLLPCTLLGATAQVHSLRTRISAALPLSSSLPWKHSIIHHNGQGSSAHGRGMCMPRFSGIHNSTHAAAESTPSPFCPGHLAAAFATCLTPTWRCFVSYFVPRAAQVLCPGGTSITGSRLFDTQTPPRYRQDGQGWV